MTAANNLALGRNQGVVVGVADMQFCDDPEDLLVTYALGSCIAVCVYEPTLRIGGMIHYMLPLSSASKDKARENPAMFADTGVPALFDGMYRRGCKKENLIVKVAGGGTLHDEKGMFKIGQRNHTILRKLFWKNGVVIDAEDVGGSKSRTVRLYIADGTVTVSSMGQEEEL